jgi:hypothetical protein
VYPPNAVAAYNAACAFALGGEDEMALRFLGAAARHGFNDSELLASDRDLASVRSRPGFESILDQVRRNQAAGIEPEVYDFAPVGGAP